MTRTATIITPADHGRRMSLEDFEFAEAREGKLYELGRGRVIVTDVPKPKHGLQVDTLRQQLDSYRVGHPGGIHFLAGGSDCKILVPGYHSERHPDLTVYMTPPPSQGDEAWRTWVPEIVVEVVSPGSEHRDYIEKPEECLALGVQEYWICDSAKQQVLVLRRRGEQWEEHPLEPGQTHRPDLLPGFELDVAAVLAAAGQI
jgi:Uma2 family endonuclease